MSNYLPTGFPRNEDDPVPSKARMKGHIEEYKAVQIYMERWDFNDVMRELDLGKRDAERMVTRGYMRFDNEVKDRLKAALTIRHNTLLNNISNVLEAVALDPENSRQLQTIDRLVKVLERQSKLVGLDAEPEEKDSGLVVNINTALPKEVFEVVDEDTERVVGARPAEIGEGNDAA